MSPRKKRILMVCAILVGISISVILILTAFEKNLMYFYSPTEIINGDAPKARSFRIGGLVVTDSVIRNSDDLKVSFILTDIRGCRSFVLNFFTVNLVILNNFF